MALTVEFIGCSGAGKTTLARAVAASGGTGVLASDLVMDRPLRRWITEPHARNVVADVTAVPWLAKTWGDNRPFVRFAFSRLDAHAPSTFARLNYKRNIVRRVGIHELARSSDGDAAVLLDEGVVLSAYHLFVYSTGALVGAELDRFAELVPLPDHLVYVTAPIDVLVRRAMERPDRRRELKSDDPARIRSEFERALRMFDSLAACERLRDRIVVVRDPVAGAPQRDAAVQQVTEVLGRNRQHGGAAQTRSPLPEGD